MSVRVPTLFPLIGCSGNKTVQFVNICSSAQSILPHAEFVCYEAKIEESEKAGSCWESNPGHLWLELPVLCHWAEHWRLKPGVLGSTLVTASLSLFLKFALVTSKVTYLLLAFPICPPMWPTCCLATHWMFIIGLGNPVLGDKVLWRW